MPRFRSTSISRFEYHGKQHRFEHWYRDNSIYFITARVRGGVHAFESEAAKQIFWECFDKYTQQFGFNPWLTSLLDNHYHTAGHLLIGENLGEMMRLIHGSAAKRVNDLLPQRIRPFWYDSGKQGYFDGCLRDEVQGRRTYRYVLLQAVRNGIVRDWRDYPHTRVNVELEDAIGRAKAEHAFMEGVVYERYAKLRQARGTDSR